ncbi:nucleoporin-like protein [Thalictrum thalictroides]|uniref:Nucleoporin-like protein n=1 Tax=Thalictrum thalictroides TaxID=46969 RepID=A0A7J6WP38_THATH|nr:nucleoporin-like protein [Thalictrum thalictroides]
MKGDLSRLTEILQSKIAVESDGDEHRKGNSDVVTAGEAFDVSLCRENLQGPDDKKEAVSLNRVVGEIPDPYRQSSVCQDLVGASPIDIAKAYMGTLTSELGVGSLGGNLREETIPLPSNVLLSKSSIPSPKQESSICWPGALVQQSHPYLTPRADRGKAGLHLFPQTPYSRSVYSRSTSKLEGGGDRSGHIYSTNLKQLTPVYSRSQMKRNPAASQNECFGSAGPIRRTRRKFHATATTFKGAMSSQPASSSPCDGSFGGSKNLLPIARKNLEPGASKSSCTQFQPLDVKILNSAGLSSSHSQSNGMAKKILEHLDRTTPSPEKKSAELKMATSWRKPPSSESTINVAKAVESSKSQPDIQIHGQKVFDQGKGRSTPLYNVQRKQRKIDEDIDAVKPQSSLFTSFSSEISSGLAAGQSSALGSTDLKKTPQSEANKNEVSTGHDERLQNEKNQSSPQQREVARQDFPGFARSTAGYEAVNVPKKLSTHTYGNKPPLTFITIAKPDPKYRVSFDNSPGFTFPVSDSGSLSEPPTPSIMPSFLATSLPLPKETRAVPSNGCTLKECGPSYSFGSKTASRALVFSFPSSSAAAPSDFSTPSFSFGSAKSRITFRSVSEDAICS